MAVNFPHMLALLSISPGSDQHKESVWPSTPADAGLPFVLKARRRRCSNVGAVNATDNVKTAFGAPFHSCEGNARQLSQPMKPLGNFIKHSAKLSSLPGRASRRTGARKFPEDRSFATHLGSLAPVHQEQ
jgi:hypothetical protein